MQVSHLESNKPLLAASIGYLRENTEIPHTDTARAISSPESAILKIFHGKLGNSVKRYWEILNCHLCFWFSWVLFESTITPYSPKFCLCFFPFFTSCWVALLCKTLNWSWTWASLKVLTLPPVILNNDLAFFTQASYFAVRFCSFNTNIFSGTMHDPVVSWWVCGKRWKTKLLDMQDPWNWSYLVNRSNWINLEAYCYQRWKVSHN